MADRAGPLLRFELAVPMPPLPIDLDDVRIAVLDTTWTPTADQSATGRLISIRDVAAGIIASVDLLAEATRLLDVWVASTTIVDDMTIDGTSLWFNVRLHDHGWLLQRILWVRVVDEVIRMVGPARIEIAGGTGPALVEAARLVAERDGLSYAAGAPDAGRPAFGIEPPSAGAAATSGPRSPRLMMSRLVRRMRTILGRAVPPDRRALERAARRRFVDDRLDRLASEPDRRLLVVLEHARQRVETPDGPRDINPHVGPIVERLRGGSLDPIEVELTARADDDVTWARMTAPDGARLLPSSVLSQGDPDPDDDDASGGDDAGVAERIAAARVPVPVAGVDLGPLLAAHVGAQAGHLVPRKRRTVARIRALIRRLDPAAILLADEYHRQDWLIAAAAEGIPVAAVQHGILHAEHNGYIHATRPPTLRLPDRTYVFGSWERDVLIEQSVYRPDEVVVGGSPRLDHVRPTVDRQAIRAALSVAKGDRLVVVSGTNGELIRRFHIPIALAAIVDRPLPRVHLVIKQHPGELDQGPYRATIERAAAARGLVPPPLSIISTIDLYQLLAAADAHVGIHSTVLTEAVLTGTPNLLFAAMASADLLGYVDAGVAAPLRSGADLLAMIDGVTPVADAPTRASFLHRHFEPGSASQRIADDLVAWLA